MNSARKKEMSTKYFILLLVSLSLVINLTGAQTIIPLQNPGLNEPCSTSSSPDCPDYWDDGPDDYGSEYWSFGYQSSTVYEGCKSFYGGASGVRIGQTTEEFIQANTIYTISLYVSHTSTSQPDIGKGQIILKAVDPDDPLNFDDHIVCFESPLHYIDSLATGWQYISFQWDTQLVSEDLLSRLLGRKLRICLWPKGGCWMDMVSLTKEPSPGTCGVSINETGGITRVSEGGTIPDTYLLVLDAQPNSDVHISIRPNVNGNDINLGAGADTPITLTFTSADYSTPQSVPVTAVDDTLFEGTETAEIAHTVSSNDPRYNGISVPMVAVQITDNDHLCDLNNDAHIDIQDLLVFTQCWLLLCDLDKWCDGADLTGLLGQTENPGTVDMADWRIFSNCWDDDGNPTIPRIMRNTLLWKTGSLFYSFSSIVNINCNVFHCFPKPSSDITGFRPPVPVQQWVDSTWENEVAQLHNENITAYASQSSNIFVPSVFTTYGLNPADYYARDPQGNPESYSSYSSACINNPNWMNLHEQTTRIYADAGFDGIWFDLNCYANTGAFFCHCSYCQAKWTDYLNSQGLSPATALPTRTNGTDMTQTVNQHHLRWRWQCWEDAWQAMFDKVKQDYPHFAFCQNLGFGTNSRPEGVYMHSMTDLYDYVHIEEYGHSCAPYSDIPSYLMGLAAGNGKQTTLVQNNDPTPNCLQHKLFIAEGYAAGGATQPGYSRCTSETGDYFDFIEAHEDYYADLKSMANVAVVLSWWSKAIYEYPNDLNPGYWMGQMLLDMHVPFDYIIAERDLGDPGDLLAKYKTVILTDFACMTDQQINTLNTYLNNGGGIIATYNTGKYNDKYVLRSPSGLNLITGQNITSTCQLNIGSGRFAYFSNRPEKEHWDNNPRQLDKGGSLTYPTLPSAAVIDAMYWVFNDSLPLVTDANITTAIILKKQTDNARGEDTILIHLVNYNVYPDASFLTPDNDIVLTVTIPSGKTISEVTVISPDFATPLIPQPITGWTQTNNKLQLTLDTLQYYSVVIIKMDKDISCCYPD
jgi:hypothetical protein